MRKNLKKDDIRKIGGGVVFLGVMAGSLFSFYNTGFGSDVASDAIDDQLLDGDFVVADEISNTTLSNNGHEQQELLAEADSIPIIQDVSADSFKDIYYQAKMSNDRTRQYTLLENMYDESKNTDLLPYLINMSVQLRKYDEALQYLKILEDQGPLHEIIQPQLLFLLLFNGLELNFKDIARIKELFLEYQQSGHASKEDVILWSALITYTRGDMANYSNFMHQLSGTVYHQRSEEYQKNLSITQSFADVPDTYLDGLTALQVFSHGWYQVARVAANRLIQADEKYILPRQLYGYASLLLGDRNEVIPAMTRLQEKDEDNEQLYRFLAGVAHVQMEQYPEAILLLRDIRDSQFIADAQRYLFLSYVAIEQYDLLDGLLPSMTSQKNLMPHDFFTFFDLFFYVPLKERSQPHLYTTYPDYAKYMVDTCYETLSKEYAFICLWGKSGLLLTTGEEEKAYQYLQRLVKRYPKSFLFEALGDIAFHLDNVDEAKRWFIQSLSVTQDETIRDETMHKVRSIILQGK